MSRRGEHTCNKHIIVNTPEKRLSRVLGNAWGKDKMLFFAAGMRPRVSSSPGLVGSRLTCDKACQGRLFRADPPAPAADGASYSIKLTSNTHLGPQLWMELENYQPKGQEDSV